MGIALQNRFDGGKQIDKRSRVANGFFDCKHFDFLTHPHRLTPFPEFVANQTLAYFLADFVIGDFGTGIGTNILAHGVISGQGISGKSELYMKTGGSNIISDAWATALTATGAATLNRGAVNTGAVKLWHLYKNYIYYGAGGTHIGRIGDLSAGTAATFAETHFDITNFTTLSNGITFSKNDAMYFGADNIMYWKSGASAIASLLTLPSSFSIVSICEYGNLIAIGCTSNDGANASATKISTVFLWDGVSSDVMDTILWGNGALKVLDSLYGVLVGISHYGGSVFTATNPRLFVRGYAGGEPFLIAEQIASNTAGIVRTHKVKQENKLYFSASDGTDYSLWIISKNLLGQLVVSKDVMPNNDTAVSTIDGFARFGDVWYVAYNADGSVNRIKTDGASDTISYTTTSVFDSLVNPNMEEGDKFRLKQLTRVAVSYIPLSSSLTASVVLQYSVDWGSFTTITTNTSTSTLATQEFEMVDAAGVQFTSGREYQFRIKSTGGAVITEIKYWYEIIDLL